MSAFSEKFKLAAFDCDMKPKDGDENAQDYSVEYAIKKKTALSVEKIRVEVKYRATKVTYKIIWVNTLAQKRKVLKTESIDYRADTTLLELQSILGKLATSGRTLADVYSHI